MHTFPWSFLETNTIPNTSYYIPTHFTSKYFAAQNSTPNLRGRLAALTPPNQNMSSSEAGVTSLFQAIDADDSSLVEKVISDYGEDVVLAKTSNSSKTALMHACETHGNVDVVQLLLSSGAPWNDVDDDGHCAGEYAAQKYPQLASLLMDYGVEVELQLGQQMRAKGEYETDTSYLSEKLKYDDDDRLLDEQGDAVMMKWETPLMKLHARKICDVEHGKESDAVVLNVGFGLGIIDGFIQELKPKTHVIIEAHPDVYAHMKRTGWDDKENVIIKFGRWQDVIDDLAKEYAFTGAFFDTYGETYNEIREFHEHLPKLFQKSKDEGKRCVYSYFNGFCPDNVFFHMVYNKLIAKELKDMTGMLTTFEPVRVDKIDWKGVTGHGKYWEMETYFLPESTYA